LSYSSFCIAIHDLILFVGLQEEHPACQKKLSDACVLVCLEQGANDLHMVQLMPMPLHTYFIKIQNGLPFWCRLTWVAVERGP